MTNKLTLSLSLSLSLAVQDMAGADSTNLPYVTKIPESIDDPYEPKIFSSTWKINSILKGRTLLNLSDYELERDEIEALVAGLGFITTDEPDPLAEMETHREAVERYIRNIDIALTFGEDEAITKVGAGKIDNLATVATPGSSSTNPLTTIKAPTALANTNKAKEKAGHLRKWIKSKWSPPRQSWQDQETSKELIEQLLNPTLIPGPIDPNIRDSEQTMRAETGIQTEPKNQAQRTETLGAVVRSHPAILRALEKLSNNESIHILSADKGGAIVIWNTEDYDKEAERQLSDTDSYERLTKDEYEKQLKETHVAIIDAAESLYRTGRIKKSELEAIRDAALCGSAIYFLCKIHKNKLKATGTFPGRPIVRTFAAIVHLLDKLLTEWTSSLLARIDGSLIDTTDLINKLPKERLPDEATITTADVNSLYPCIPLDHGIAASVEFYSTNYEQLKKEFEEKGLLPPPSPPQFERVLTLVMRNSFITFKNRDFFRQRKGTAMGICISVYFANCYMWKVSQRVLTRQIELPGVVTFLRFIDDILVIQTDGNRDVLKQLFESITNEDCTYVIDNPGRKQSFLDVVIYFAENGLIETEPFTKATSTESFLHYLSNHPKHCRDSIPYAQLIRLRRITSDFDKFMIAALKLIRAFKYRDYPEDLLIKQLKKVAKMDRKDLLDRENPTKKTDSETKPASQMPARKRSNKFTREPKSAKKKAKLEAKKATVANQDPSEGPTFRLITPFTNVVDNKKILDTLRALDMERRKQYPIGHAHHKLMESGRSVLIHSKRAPTQSRFTKIIKNPHIPINSKLSLLTSKNIFTLNNSVHKIKIYYNKIIKIFKITQCRQH